jgi:glutaredoxin 3
MPDVVIYTQAWCPFCERAVYTLTKKGVAFREIDAPHGSVERARSVKLSGRTTVPQIFIGDRHIGGCDEMMALDRAGRLDSLLGLA